MTDSTTAPETAPYDPEFWIEVPLVFPTSMFADAASWAGEVAEQAEPTDEPMRERVRVAAQVLAESPRLGAWRRFWFFPLTGQMTATVDYFRLERDAQLEARLIDVLGEVEDASTEPVVTERQVPGFERVVRVARLARESAGSGSPSVYGTVRIARVSTREIEIFETVNDDLTGVSSMLEELERLVEQLPVESGDSAQ